MTPNISFAEFRKRTIIMHGSFDTFLTLNWVKAVTESARAQSYYYCGEQVQETC